MRFCTGLPVAMFVRDARQGKPQSIQRVVGEVEELGFWAVTAIDHILDPQAASQVSAYAESPGWYFADPLTLLSYLAAVSTTIKLMPRVLVIPYRPPIPTAHALATIDSLSGGRLVLSTGVGTIASEFKGLGVPIRERGRMTDEYLETMFGLWANERFSYSGRYYHFEDMGLMVRPVQQPRPELWVGGQSRAGLERAVRIGDAWAPVCRGQPSSWEPKVRAIASVAEIREAAAWAQRQRAALGKPPLAIGGSSMLPLVFTDRPRWPGRRREQIEYFTCEGTPEELLEEFLTYKEAGVTDFAVNFPGNTPEKFLRSARTFAKEIMPVLQQ
jgi:probable F420-dependent oxidoreductase